MMGASIGLLFAVLLILFGLCIVVTAAAWLPAWPRRQAEDALASAAGLSLTAGRSWLSGSWRLMAAR